MDAITIVPAAPDTTITPTKQRTIYPVIAWRIHDRTGDVQVSAVTPLGTLPLTDGDVITTTSGLEFKATTPPLGI